MRPSPKRGYDGSELADTATDLKLTENLPEDRLGPRVALAAVAALAEGQGRVVMLTVIGGHSGLVHDTARRTQIVLARG